jgi:NitT/TauT family transport system permease protein
MEGNERQIRQPFRLPAARIDLRDFRIDGKKMLYRLITFATLVALWHLAALHYNNQLVLPTPWKTFQAFIFAIQDAETLENLAITLRRVALGLGIATLIGFSVGLAMGYSTIVNKLVDPIIGPLRQVPIMAWVPLTIVWFGLGEGPTLFLIAMVATFPIMLNTMAGVQNVPKNYYHAARSMGAGRRAIFTRITLPSALPDIITGLRIGLSSGWMSVI